MSSAAMSPGQFRAPAIHSATKRGEVDSLIELEDVSVVREERTLLDRVCLKVRRGEHTAILGPNGCGKSTLIRAMTREIHPFAGLGTVRFCSRDRWSLAELRTLVGFVGEEPKGPLLGNPTGLQVAVSGFLGTFGVTAQSFISQEMWDCAYRSLGRVGAAALQDQTLSTMSTGERRRCWIARALVCKPQALVLDEPTSGLDLVAAHRFLHELQALACDDLTIVMVTHHLQELIPAIGRVILLKSGRIAFDGLRHEALEPDRLAFLYSIDSPELMAKLRQELAPVQQTAYEPESIL